MGASGTAALDGALPDALDVIAAVSRSLETATPYACFGGCEGFTTGSALGTFRVATVNGALLEPSDIIIVSRSFGSCDTLRLPWWWWRGLYHNRFNFGNLWNCYT